MGALFQMLHLRGLPLAIRRSQEALSRVHGTRYPRVVNAQPLVAQKRHLSANQPVTYPRGRMRTATYLANEAAHGKRN